MVSQICALQCPAEAHLPSGGESPNLRYSPFLEIETVDSIDMQPLQASDPYQPIEIADRIWWVGHHQDNDAFQCHVYLLEHGDQSVLFDPGSVITFRQTLKKIESVLPLSQIRYFVCHHQDPDITGVMPLIDDMVDRPDACLVTHWRAEALIKHYDLKLPFWRIENHNWELDLGGRRLKFVFTPYAHFPGAFCTFDEKTGVLFSSDLFGGFTERFSLYAENEDYFEALRPFHEHYVPSREILNFAIEKIQEHPVRMIAPQHGSIIPEPLIEPITEKLKQLECGLYLMTGDTSKIQRLSQFNQTLRDLTKALVLRRDFTDMVNELLTAVRRVLPAEDLEFYAWLYGGQLLHLSPDSRYRGILVEPQSPIKELLGIDHKSWATGHPTGFVQLPASEDESSYGSRLVFPLFAPDRTTAHAVAVIRLSSRVPVPEDIKQLLEEMNLPLQVAVEREMIQRATEFERQQFYERSIHDPLTGLFTRFYMEDTVRRLFDIHDRDPNAPVAVVMLDIDRFKPINDNYGHNQGDDVLRRIADVLKTVVRSGDLPVRLGGEEFAVFVAAASAVEIGSLAERLRQQIEELRFDGSLADLVVTVSLGSALRRQREDLRELLNRADIALYQAKRAGGNRVVTAESQGENTARRAECAEE